MKKVMSIASKGVILYCLIEPGIAFARYNFDSSFFKAAGLGDAEHVDLTLFNEGASFSPGDYKLSVYINGDFASVKTVRFIKDGQYTEPAPCFTASEWHSLGIRVKDSVASECAIPSYYIPSAVWRVDMNTMRLNISVPQISLERGDLFTSPWQTWDAGNNAFLLNYHYSYSDNQYRHSSDTSQYLGVESGINLLGLRFRNSSSWVENGDKKREFNSIRSYVQKDYHFLQGGELTLGETWSDGSLFSSVPFKGVMAASQDTMLRTEFQSFTPAIRGVVNSQSATVSVFKNGQVIYQSTLPVGPFSLDGIMSNGGGEYQVEIKESDGSVRRYTQSSDSLPALQSKGRLKYNALIGKTNFANTTDQSFSQASLFYGLTDSITTYGGTTFSDNYQAYSVGLGKMMEGYGAVAFDVTASDVTLPYDKSARRGQSFRISYSKDFDETETSLGLFAYRYSTKDYLDFNDFSEYRSNDAQDVLNKKNRLEATLNQRLSQWGHLSLSGSQQSYWDGANSTLSFNVNHNISFGRFSLNTYYAENKNQDDARDRIFGLGVSMSLADNGRNYTLVNTATRRNGDLGNQTSANMSLLDDNRLSLSASQSLAERDDPMYGLAANYIGNLYELSGGYYKSTGTQNMNAGIRGGAVLHGGGLTLSRSYPLDSPRVIIQTPGVSDVRISNNQNVQTDYFGHAVIGNLQPYQRNPVSINASSLKAGVETAETDTVVIPRKGSVIPVKFSVSQGLRALFDVSYGGKPIPLGAVANMVGDGDNPKAAFFADKGQVYLTGLDNKGRVRVKWGHTDTASCEFAYELNNASLTALHRQSFECR